MHELNVLISNQLSSMDDSLSWYPSKIEALTFQIASLPVKASTAKYWRMHQQLLSVVTVMYRISLVIHHTCFWNVRLALSNDATNEQLGSHMYRSCIFQAVELAGSYLVMIKKRMNSIGQAMQQSTATFVSPRGFVVFSFTATHKEICIFQFSLLDQFIVVLAKKVAFQLVMLYVCY